MGAPVQNPNDGTQLGTAEVISDEFVDPSSHLVRAEPLLPSSGYKLPRSKIAVGKYGTDGGDAAIGAPLIVEDFIERQLHELDSMRQRDQTMVVSARYAYDTIPMHDRRGSHLTDRGQR